ncbi:MAG: ATP-binding protein [Desulfovibrio sp.]
MPTKSPWHTEFAPAGREPLEVVRAQARMITSHSPRMMLDGLPLPVVVVNSKRQIVFCNRKFEDFSLEQEDVLPLGRRPGEALGCVYADLTPGGCGTTRFCRFCGAARAILQSLDGSHSVQLCRLLRKKEELGCLDFQVFAEPLLCEGVSFVLFSVLDISKELRLDAIRRKFLGEVRRRAESINRLFVNASRDMERDPSKGGFFALGYASRMLMEEIDSQSRLFDAEEGLLGVNEEHLDAREMLEQAVAAMANSEKGPEGAGDWFEVRAESCAGLRLLADRLLLGYILRQLLENGLEAIGPGEQVRLGCVDLGEQVGLRIATPTPLPDKHRLQLFQRGFSTKGEGRGLGLYFSRLLARRYLNGDLLLLEEEPGTVFEVRMPKV